MRPRERTPARIAFGTVAASSGPGDRADRPGLEIDRANHVVFRVGDVEPPARPRQPLRPGEHCQTRRTVVAAVALLAGPRHVMDRPRPSIDTIDGVALAEGEIQMAVTVERDRPRTV